MCVHHWTIEPAESAQSEGVCTRCGATRMFQNTAVPREDDARFISARTRGPLDRPRRFELARSNHAFDSWD